MKFKPGPLVGEMSGSIGSMVMSHNRFGTYARTRVTPVNPDTPDQQSARNIFGALSAAWKLLDPPTRLAWSTYASNNPVIDKLGQAQNLTGAMTYIALNARRVMHQTAACVLPPVSPAPLAFSSITLTADIGLGGCQIAFTDDPLIAQMAMWVKACITTSASVNFVKGRFRFLMYSATAAPSPIDIQTELVAKFGTLQAGHYLHVKVYVLDVVNGQLSMPLQASSIITFTE